MQIVGEGEVNEFKSSSGEVYVRHEYTLPAYNENGEEHEVIFSAHKPLREGAYLKMYVNKHKEVTSYDEVPLEDIPVKAKENIVK